MPAIFLRSAPYARVHLAVLIAAAGQLFVAQATAQEIQNSGAAAVRNQIEEQSSARMNAERDLVLRESAVEVARSRVAALQAQLDEANRRAATEEAQAQALKLKVEEISAKIVQLSESLPSHEAADNLVVTAGRKSARLQALSDSRQRLQGQLADLRKSSVEWRSRQADAEQQIATLTAQRPELEKKSAEAKTASEAADAAVAAAQTAEAGAKAAEESIAAELRKSEEQVATAAASLERLTGSQASLERSLATLKEASALTGVDSSSAIQGLEKAIADFQPLQVSSQTLLSKAVAVKDEQAARLTTARAEHEKTSAALAAAVAAAEPLKAAWQSAAAAVTASLEQQSAQEAVKAEATRWQAVLAGQLTSLDPSVQKLTAEIGIAREESLVASRAAEAALEPLGRFVSYSRAVAPVFARRCVACHNTRSAGGRLNLDSFSALLKGGESGAAVNPHHSAESLLISMMEDGSMPKDADPLTPEEISVVRHWIDVGAPLDAGLSPTSDLFDVMPELSQPLPPAEYRVAIPVTAVAFSPDGALLASSGYHEVLLWNTVDGSLARRITNVAERIYDLEFAQDGQSLAVAAGTPGQLGELKLFAAADGQLIRTFVRARDAVFATAFSPDGTLLACAGADRAIEIVRVADGAVVHRIEDHADWVMDIAWSPNGQRLVSASRDKSCKVFDAVTGNPVITFSGHGEPVYSAVFLSDNTTVVSGGSDRKLRVWNSTDAKEARAIAGFGGDIFRIQVLPGDQILSACGDRNLHQHNPADGTELRQLAGHGDWVYTLSAHAGSKRIASGSYDGEIRIWNSEDGSIATSFIAIPRSAPGQSVASAAE